MRAIFKIRSRLASNLCNNVATLAGVNSGCGINTAASRSDKLAHTVGYDQVVEVASQAFCARRYRLVEAAAGAVAQAILDRFPQVLRVRVTVHKPHAPIAATFAGVGVTIVRDRQGRG